MLSRRSDRIFLDPYDLSGVLKVLGERINLGDDRLAYYLGAHQALNLIDKWPQIDNQQAFMSLFDRNLQAYIDEIDGKEGARDEEDEMD